ncbi:uncharacterized protein METZ01_LOCUS626 [marine metagenome]|uniref:Uncharacterized protein n=1 Tax=marine metagenome TaxID=408172 RepID=A0A381MZK8_9ZZZZ
MFWIRGGAPLKGTAIGWLTRLFATYDSQASFGSLFRTGPK